MLIICLMVCWLDGSFNLHKQLLIYWLSYIKHWSIDIGIFLSVIRKHILESKSWYFPNTGLYFSWNKYYHTARTYTGDACIINKAYSIRYFSYQIADKIIRFDTIRFFGVVKKLKQTKSSDLSQSYTFCYPTIINL